MTSALLLDPWLDAHEAAREARGMVCGHVTCGCVKHKLLRALADTEAERGTR